MNHDEVMNLQAGQDLDLMIAKEVFRYSADEWRERVEENEYQYSDRLSCAFQVVEFLQSLPRGFPVDISRIPAFSSSWRVAFRGMPSVTADTLPLAICRAALLVVTNLGQ